MLCLSTCEGMTVKHVAVTDIVCAPDDVTSADQIKREISWINDQLAMRRDWAPPHVVATGDERRLAPNNPVAEWMFDSAPGLRRWRETLVPSAIALTPLYEAGSWRLPNGEPIDPKTRAYFIHSLDAIGIRTRAAIMRALASSHVEVDGALTNWTSLACGGAIPVLDAVKRFRGTHRFGVTLVDIDPCALDHARQKAGARGVGETADFTILERNLIEGLIRTDNLVAELGTDSQNLVDMLGIFEYVSEDFGGFDSAGTFLRNAFRLVKPGGALVAANMLDTHPQIHFNQRAIGWPKIHPRSLTDIHRILTNAGIDPSWVTVLIPEDGVYAVFEIRKPPHPQEHESAVA